ncbi:MAG TPA: DUF2062 domain-containing protein [Flavobacterium sp.]|uniref:DUF2062 domain-containing protein n=1 Tax=Flavobacterium sp. TaxID=239 RepID=UPI002C784E4B|nr:DUF2062 domain-containing protein [Flavobacterium sp.]HSD14643.1 DUF2062 domain-containing protein [Flavobacterium sp.]
MKWKTIVDFFWKIAKSNSSAEEIAWGAAIGTFISVFPTFGLGMLLVIVLSRLLKFNLTIALAASIISNPFTSPFFMLLNYKVGSLFFDSPIVFDVDNWKDNLKDTGLAIFIGSLIVSGSLAVIAYFFSKFMVLKFRNKKEL